MSLRRLCLYGGPGCGKSVVAAQIFAALKLRHMNIELVTEYIKEWVYDGRQPDSFDQIYIFTKQLRKEDLLLRNGKVDIIVTDSPLFLSTCYAKKFQTPGWQSLISLTEEFDKVYPALHILLERGSKPYNTNGRYQTLNEAVQMDWFIKQALIDANKEFHTFETVTIDNVMPLLERDKT